MIFPCTKIEDVQVTARITFIHLFLWNVLIALTHAHRKESFTFLGFRKGNSVAPTIMMLIITKKDMICLFICDN